jgi:hypothetical protein
MSPNALRGNVRTLWNINVRDGDRAKKNNKNEIAVFVFGVTAKHFPHDMLP